jgi:hypothetical protein
MKVKAYIFEDINEGIERIKEEYGADTMILDIKDTSKNSRKSCEISIRLDDPEFEEDNTGALRKKTEEIWSHTAKLLSEKIIDLELDMIKDRAKQYSLLLRVFFQKMSKNGFDIHRAFSMISEIYEEEMLGHICHNLIFLKQPVCCLTTGMDISDVLTLTHETFYKILLEENIWKTGEKRLLQ